LLPSLQPVPSFAAAAAGSASPDDVRCGSISTVQPTRLMRRCHHRRSRCHPCAGAAAGVGPQLRCNECANAAQHRFGTTLWFRSHC
jgi:hypothetical protein